MGHLDDYMAGRLYGDLPWIICPFVGKGFKYKPYFAREMAEEFDINIEPNQFEPKASESDCESSHDWSEDKTYDVNEERIGQVDW